MTNIMPISDLRNYSVVLKICQVGEKVLLTKNGRGKSVVMDIEEYEKAPKRSSRNLPSGESLSGY